MGLSVKFKALKEMLGRARMGLFVQWAACPGVKDTFLMSVPEGKAKVLSLNNRLNILGFKCFVFSLEGGPVKTFGSIFGNPSTVANDRWLWSSQQCNNIS